LKKEQETQKLDIQQETHFDFPHIPFTPKTKSIKQWFVLQSFAVVGKNYYYFFQLEKLSKALD
jgi:hypothetical protein